MTPVSVEGSVQPSYETVRDAFSQVVAEQPGTGAAESTSAVVTGTDRVLGVDNTWVWGSGWTTTGLAWGASADTSDGGAPAADTPLPI
jgi:hypothetical protein